MADMVQANARVPEAARPVLLAVAARLRDDPGFLDRLQGFLADEAGGSPWADRIEAIEARLTALEGAAKYETISHLSPSAPAAAALDADWPARAAAITVSTGEGHGRKLTTEGAALFDEMVRAGVHVPEIARILGMAKQSVHARAKKLGAGH